MATLVPGVEAKSWLPDAGVCVYPEISAQTRPETGGMVERCEYPSVRSRVYVGQTVNGRGRAEAVRAGCYGMKYRVT